MKLRKHRGGLKESMETEIEIDNNINSLTKAINESNKYDIEVTNNMVDVSFYSYDKRINQNCYVVVVKGHGVYGFTDEELAQEK